MRCLHKKELYHYQISANCSGKSKVYKRCKECQGFIEGYELTNLPQEVLEEIYEIAKKNEK